MIQKIRSYFKTARKIYREVGARTLLTVIINKLFPRVRTSLQPMTVKHWLKYYEKRGGGRRKSRSYLDIDKYPKVSILILTYNNFDYNKLCLYSIYSNTTYPNFEVIVVDNASSDETPEWLSEFSRSHDNFRLILNKENLGFAGGNNQAAREADGEFLVFLNNDTVVTQGWIEGLLARMQDDPVVGLVGPVTNSTGNEARIPVQYGTPAEMEKFASDRVNLMAGRYFDIRMLAFYCVMARKGQYELMGGLDERYSVGMFEDDDIAIRYHQQGFRVVCAEDVFIHHFQGASFGKLDNERYQKIFDENRRKYEEKWGRKWEPYEFRKLE